MYTQIKINNCLIRNAVTEVFLLLLPHSAHSELPGFLMSSPMILTFRSTMMPAAVQLCAGETGADSEDSGNTLLSQAK
jgi:hypothetical protein